MLTRLPRRVLYGELIHGSRSQGGQKKRFSDHIKSKTILKMCNVATDQLQTHAADRSTRWDTCMVGLDTFSLECNQATEDRPPYPPARHCRPNTKRPVRAVISATECVLQTSEYEVIYGVTSDYQHIIFIVSTDNVKANSRQC